MPLAGLLLELAAAGRSLPSSSAQAQLAPHVSLHSAPPRRGPCHTERARACRGAEFLGTDQAHLRLAGAEGTVRRREELYSTGSTEGGTPEQRALREAHERGGAPQEGGPGHPEMGEGQGKL